MYQLGGTPNFTLLLSNMPETSTSKPVQDELELSESRSLWEDSRLIRQWYDAVEEYQKYHSFAAQGVETLDDLKQKQATAIQEKSGTGPTMITKKEVSSSDKSSKDSGPIVAEAGDEYEDEDEGESEGEDDDDENQDTHSSMIIPPENVPPGNQEEDILKPSISLEGFDEGTKSLIMAWYWAGYYQGLELGKKMAQK